MAKAETQTMGELISDLEMEIEIHSAVLAAAHSPSLPPEERLKVIEAGRSSWARIEAVKQEMERMAG